MRKIVIVVLFIVEAMIIFTILFQAENSLRYNEFIKAESVSDSHKVILPVTEENAGSIYNALSRLSDQYQANVIAARMKIEDEAKRYSKYVYITRPEFYAEFTFEGDSVYPAHGSGQFLSSEETGHPEQIGRIASFTRSEIFEIRSLQEMLTVPEIFDGAYTIQIEEKSFEAFCSEFFALTGVMMQDSKISSATGGFDDFLEILVAVIVCIHLIVTLVVVYDFTKDAKSIAVEKMLGYKKSSIWGRRMFRLIRNQTLAVGAVFAVAGLIFLEATNTFAMIFLLKLAFVGALSVITTFIFSLVTFVSISRVNIVSMLKNLRPLPSVSAVNMTAKIALMTLIIFIGQSALVEYSSIQGIHAMRFAQWQEAHDLYVLDTRVWDIDDWLSEKTTRKRGEIYFSVNKNGSILADFDVCTPTFQTINTAVPSLKYAAASVNPNYLKKFPIYDLDGNPVQITEEDEDLILLVPVAFKSEEVQIREHYQWSLNTYLPTETTPSGLKFHDQKINIIWVKDNQKYFSYNLSVNPDEGNMVSNVVLNIVTENNSDVLRYDVAMSYIGNPLKIKAASADPQAEIYEIVRNYGFDGNVVGVVSVYGSVAQEVEESLRMIGFVLFAIVILALVLAMIIIQSIQNYFDKHKRLISIRTFMGQFFRQKYGGYFLRNIAAAWVIIILVSLLISSTDVLLLCFCLMAAEILASLLTIIIIEKRKILDALKGGH